MSTTRWRRELWKRVCKELEFLRARNIVFPQTLTISTGARGNLFEFGGQDHSSGVAMIIATPLGTPGFCRVLHNRWANEFHAAVTVWPECLVGIGHHRQGRENFAIYRVKTIELSQNQQDFGKAVLELVTKTPADYNDGPKTNGWYRQHFADYSQNINIFVDAIKKKLYTPKCTEPIFVEWFREMRYNHVSKLFEGFYTRLQAEGHAPDMNGVGDNFYIENDAECPTYDVFMTEIQNLANSLVEDNEYKFVWVHFGYFVDAAGNLNCQARLHCNNDGHFYPTVPVETMFTYIAKGDEGLKEIEAYYERYTPAYFRVLFGMETTIWNFVRHIAAKNTPDNPEYYTAARFVRYAKCTFRALDPTENSAEAADPGDEKFDEDDVEVAKRDERAPMRRTASMMARVPRSEPTKSPEVQSEPHPEPEADPEPEPVQEDPIPEQSTPVELDDDVEEREVPAATTDEQTEEVPVTQEEPEKQEFETPDEVRALGGDYDGWVYNYATHTLMHAPGYTDETMPKPGTPEYDELLEQYNNELCDEDSGDGYSDEAFVEGLEVPKDGTEIEGWEFDLTHDELLLAPGHTYETMPKPGTAEYDNLLDAYNEAFRRRNTYDVSSEDVAEAEVSSSETADKEPELGYSLPMQESEPIELTEMIPHTVEETETKEEPTPTKVEGDLLGDVDVFPEETRENPLVLEEDDISGILENVPNFENLILNSIGISAFSDAGEVLMSVHQDVNVVARNVPGIAGHMRRLGSVGFECSIPVAYNNGEITAENVQFRISIKLTNEKHLRIVLEPAETPKTVQYALSKASIRFVK